MRRRRTDIAAHCANRGRRPPVVTATPNSGPPDNEVTCQFEKERLRAFGRAFCCGHVTVAGLSNPHSNLKRLRPDSFSDSFLNGERDLG